MEATVDFAKSEYSLIDESIESSSIFSSNKNYKYFTRKPINNLKLRSKDTGKIKEKRSTQFCGFYSPTQKQDALIKKSMIQKALYRSPIIRSSNCQQNQNSTNDSQDSCKKEKDILFRHKSSNNLESVDKHFKKKKIITEDYFNSKNHHNQGEISKNRYQQLEDLRLENTKLKSEIIFLLEHKRENQSLIAQQKLTKIIIADLQNKIGNLQKDNYDLQKDLQQIKYIQQQFQALDSVHSQTTKSLNQINQSLKQQILKLNQTVKYLCIEISTLKIKVPDQSMSRIIKERNKFNQKNKQLRDQIVKLNTKIREHEMFELTPENTARDFY